MDRRSTATFVLFLSVSVSPYVSPIVPECIADEVYVRPMTDEEQDEKLARSITTATSKKGELEYRMAQLYREGKTVGRNMDKVVFWLGKASDKGYTPAMLELADMYLEGKETARDVKTAIRYLETASKNESGTACLILGDIYHTKEHRNPALAFRYYEKGWKLKHAPCGARLGFMYMTGEHVQKNVEKAYGLWVEAAQMEDMDAEYWLGLLFLHGCPGIAENPVRAADYFKRASDSGHTEATVHLARLYLMGHGVVQDYTRALEYFGKAAEDGSGEAYFELGLLYRDGHGTMKNREAAERYFEQACEKGDRRGCHGTEEKRRVGSFRGEGTTGRRSASDDLRDADIPVIIERDLP